MSILDAGRSVSSGALSEPAVALRRSGGGSGTPVEGDVGSVGRIRHGLAWLLGPYARSPRLWEERQIRFMTLAGAALMYAAVYTPHWTWGGDAEAFLGIARNMVLGQGYSYNGQPVGLVPPGWPLVLAAGMYLTPFIGILKLIPLTSILVYLTCAWCVLRRYASPWLCAAAIGATAIMHPVVQQTMYFFSDALFVACSWGALLLAIQARERWQAGESRRKWAWRIGGAVILLMAAVSVRWTGILWAPMVALALVDGRQLGRIDWRRGVAGLRLWPRRVDAMWIGAFIAGLATLVAFFALRAWLRVDEATLDPRYSTFLAGSYELVNQHGRPTIWTHVERILNGPQWLSVLYWNQVGRTQPFVMWAWWLAAVTAVPLAVGGVLGLVRRQWLWLGMAAAWIPVVATWPAAIDRYSLPVAPMLVLGTLTGTIWLTCRCRAAFPRAIWPIRFAPALAMTPAVGLFFAYNLTFWGYDVYAARDPVARYEAGSQGSLNQIGYWMRTNTDEGYRAWRDGELAVCPLRVYNSKRFASLGMRQNAVWQTNMNAMDVPASLGGPPSDRLARWAQQHNVRWYIHLPPQRRFFHIHGHPWREIEGLEWLDMDWQLYELRGGVFLPVDIGEGNEAVLIVPGLEDVRSLGPKRSWIPIPYN